MIRPILPTDKQVMKDRTVERTVLHPRYRDWADISTFSFPSLLFRYYPRSRLLSRLSLHSEFRYSFRDRGFDQ